jgi:hypothetical protein
MAAAKIVLPPPYIYGADGESPLLKYGSGWLPLPQPFITSFDNAYKRS